MAAIASVPEGLIRLSPSRSSLRHVGVQAAIASLNETPVSASTNRSPMSVPPSALTMSSPGQRRTVDGIECTPTADVDLLDMHATHRRG